MFTEERHCRDKYDQNGVGTKAAEGCFFWGGREETKVTEGFFISVQKMCLYWILRHVMSERCQ